MAGQWLYDLFYSLTGGNVWVAGFLAFIAFSLFVGAINSMSDHDKDTAGAFIGGAALVVGAVLAAIFLLVKFVQWAWNA